MASKVLTVNQELISYTYPHRAMRMVWFGVLGFVWNHSASAILQQQKKGGKKENKEEDSGIGNSSKEAVVSSWVHAALCALREQLCECLWGSALQCCSMARAGCHPTGLLPIFAPIWSSLPSPNHSVGQNSLKGPSLGASPIPYPASLPAVGQASWGGSCWPQQKARAWCHFEPNPADI